MKQYIKSSSIKIFNANLLLFLAYIILNLNSCVVSKKEFTLIEWEKNPNNRYVMVDSLIEKLKTEKPDKNQVKEMLGEKQDLDNIKSNELDYYLKSNSIIGIDYLSLVITFDGDKFMDAKIVRSD